MIINEKFSSMTKIFIISVSLLKIQLRLTNNVSSKQEELTILQKCEKYRDKSLFVS